MSPSLLDVLYNSSWTLHLQIVLSVLAAVLLALRQRWSRQALLAIGGMALVAVLGTPIHIIVTAFVNLVGGSYDLISLAVLLSVLAALLLVLRRRPSRRRLLALGGVALAAGVLSLVVYDLFMFVFVLGAYRGVLAGTYALLMLPFDVAASTTLVIVLLVLLRRPLTPRVQMSLAVVSLVAFGAATVISFLVRAGRFPWEVMG